MNAGLSVPVGAVGAPFDPPSKAVSHNPQPFTCYQKKRASAVRDSLGSFFYILSLIGV